MTADRPPSRIPIRGSLALTLTVGGLALLLGFRAPQVPPAELALAIDTSDDLASSPETLGPAGGGATADAVASPPASPSADPSASAAASLPASASPGLSADPTPTSEATSSTLTATGEAIEFRWGAVQVVVTLDGDQIVDVQALEMPDGDRRSASISRQVEPILREYALAADSADIDVVSGATYTSRAYAYSLQSALDQLVEG
jgi:uncharacterized protein with FMN-binding domain